MSNSNSYKKHRILSQFSQLTKSFGFIKYVILMMQAYSVIFFMLVNFENNLKGQIPYFSQFINSSKQIFFSYEQAKIFSIFGIICFSFLLVLNIILIKMMPQCDQITEHKKFHKFMLIALLFLMYASQGGLYLILWGYSQIYRQEGLILFALKAFIPVACYTFINYKNYFGYSLYGWFSVAIAFQLTLIPNAFSYLITITISLYFILSRNLLFQKILLSFIIVIAIFVLKNSQIFEDVQVSQMKIPLICLGISILLTLILVFKVKQKLNLANSQEKILNCFNVLTQLKGDVPHTQMKFHQFYQLYNSVVNFTLQAKQQKMGQIENILQKRPQQVTKNDLIILLEKHLQKQSKQKGENNILKQILLLKIKIELDYSMNSLIQELYSIHDELQRSDKKHQAQFFALYDLVIKKYGIIKNGELQPACINYMNKAHENFQNKINSLLDKLANFWQYISQQQIKRSSLDSHFSQVLKIQEQIQEIYKNMQNLGSFQRQKKLISISRTMLNAYEQQSKSSSVQFKRSNQTVQNQLNHSYLIIQNKTIKFISKNLLKSLDQSGSLAFQNVDKKVLFGQQFADIVDNRLKNLTYKNQTEEFTIPIFCRKGFMQLKKIKILWFPSLQSKNRYLINFSQDYQLSNQAFMIYHCKTDTIRYFNQRFVENFNINRQKLQYQISNYQIFFNELFVNTDIPAQDIKSAIKQEQAIRCKIYIKNYVDAGYLPSIPVQIKAVKCIAIQNQPSYCIIKINKLKQKKQVVITQTGTDSKNVIKDSKFMNSNQNVLAKKYQKQTFFCKIPNHYESKITEKQAQLEESGRFIYRHLIHILFGMMFISILVFWTMDYRFMQNRIQDYKKFNVALENVSQQYALFYQQYSVAIKRYYIQKFPDQFFLVRKIPGFVFDGIYATVQQGFLDEFLKRYLTQINQQPNKIVPYGINFTYFSIQTDTDKSTLMDFAQNFKRNIATSELSFLLTNYDNFRNLTINYQSSFSYEDSIYQIVSSTTMYYWMLMSTTTVVLVVIIYTLFKIEAAIQIVYSLIDLISVKQLKRNIKQFNLKRKRLSSLFGKTSENNNQKDKQQQIDYQTASQKQLKQKIRSQNLKSLNSQNKNLSSQNKSMNSQNKSMNSQNRSIDDKIEQAQELNENEINENKKLITSKEASQIQTNQKVIDQSIMIKIYRKLFFVILLITFNLIFYFDYTSLMTEQEGIIQALGIKKKLYISLLHVKRQEVDAAILPTMQSYFNKTIPNQYHSSSIDLISQIQNEIKLKELQNFGFQARKLLSSNLCANVETAFISVKPCETYLNGIVTKGFGETFDIYKQNAKIVSALKISQFALYTCTIAKCPPYFQHQFVSILLGQNVRNILKLYNKQINNSFNQMIQKTKLKTAYKIIGLILTLFLYIICDYSLKSRCHKAIKYFRIIPKQIMSSVKITTYMRKNKTLNKFDIL